MSNSIWQGRTDEVRQVQPHRSGWQNRRAVSAGNIGLLLAAAMAMAGEQFPITARQRFSGMEPRPQTVNLGRRAEKGAITLAKAEAKRQRKAAKRAQEREQ